MVLFLSVIYWKLKRTVIISVAINRIPRHRFADYIPWQSRRMSNSGMNPVLSDMTITDAGVHSGKFRIALPGHEYMAVRLTRV